MKILPIAAALLIVFGVLASGVDIASAAYDAPVGMNSPMAVQEADDTEEGESKDLPWVPIVALSIIVPLAVLLLPSFLMGGEKEASQVE